jgi:hypothetical protein
MAEHGPVRHFDDRAGYRAALDELLADCPGTLDIFDTDLVDTGLADAQRIAVLQQVLANDAKAAIRIVLHDPAMLQARMPRLLALCETHSHGVQVRQSPRNLRHVSELFMLTPPGSALVRFHGDHWRGKILRRDAPGCAGYASRFGQLWELSTCCISTTKLGL